jgi:hypothetical protein
MSRRIEIELTSDRGDGTWTWRAAGARAPKGVVGSDLLPPDARVGAVLRAEVEHDVDGIAVIAVLGGKTERERKVAERIELIERTFEPVVSTLVPKGERRRDDRGDRGDRRGRDDRPRRDGRPGARPGGERGPRPGGERGPRPGGERGPRPDSRGPRPEGADRPRGPRPDRPAGERPRAPRPPRPEPEPKPKPKRLRAGRAHRQELIASLPAEQQPIAEQLFRGGMQAVRQALDEQNASLKAEGKPEVRADGVLRLAEELQPKVRLADWRDRAHGALADVDELDLRDLRSVVVGAEVAREEADRALAGQLRDALARRQDQAHQEWLAEVTGALDDGRVVRALRLSSRPPKAGTVFPSELAGRLVEATNASLSVEATTERWVAVLDAAAYAPVHQQVAPVSVPTEVSDELRAAVTRFGPLLPQVAAAFGITVPANARPPRPQRPPRKGGAPGGAPAKAAAPRPAPAAPAAPAAAEPAAEVPEPTPAEVPEPAAEVPEPTPAEVPESAAEVPEPTPAEAVEPAAEPATAAPAED